MIRLSCAGLLAALAPVSVTAQDLPQPTPTPAPLPTFIPVPTGTPTPTPTPTAVPTATPTAAATPAATPTLRQEARTPRVRPIPTPTPTSTPLATQPPPPVSESVVPAVGPIATPAPASPVSASSRSLWPWLLALAAVFGAAALFLRRRLTADLPEPGSALDAATDPVPPPPVVSAGLKLAFRPTRAGLNMLSATVEGELTVVNTGSAAADGVRVRATLLTAHPGLDADLAALGAEPVARPAVPPFALAPGETRTIRVVAAASRDALQVLNAGERPMVVPVVAVDVRHAAGGAAQAWAVGIERVDSAKLAPFWLDVPPRSYAQVAARPHGAAHRTNGGIDNR